MGVTGLIGRGWGRGDGESLEDVLYNDSGSSSVGTVFERLWNVVAVPVQKETVIEHFVGISLSGSDKVSGADR